jgi:hypothetical protein
MKNVLKMMLAFCCFNVLCLCAMVAQGASPTSGLGSLWVMGANNYGRLGDGETGQTVLPRSREERIRTAQRFVDPIRSAISRATRTVKVVRAILILCAFLVFNPN